MHTVGDCSPSSAGRAGCPDVLEEGSGVLNRKGTEDVRKSNPNQCIHKHTYPFLSVLIPPGRVLASPDDRFVEASFLGT